MLLALMLMTITLLGTTNSTVGTTNSTEAISDSSGDCTRVAQLAASVMTARQNGVSIERAQKLISRGSNSANVDSALDSLVSDAYSEPIAESPEEQAVAILEFKSKWYRNCNP